MALSKPGLPSRLARKLAIYGQEAAFALRAPSSTRQRLRMLAGTAHFHYRNWRKLAPDPTRRETFDLALSGQRAPLTLRPRDGDLAILYEIFVSQAYEIPSTSLDPAGVTVIVDAGANIGLASLFFAARYPNARILAVEPNPENFALLEANTAHVRRIVPIQACVTPEPDQQVYIATSGRGSHFHMTTAERGTAVPGMSIEQLADSHNVSRIDLLKMDVEGAEQAIFAKSGFLARVGTIVAELHGNYDLAHFAADLAPWNFDAWKPNPAGDPALVLATRRA